MKLDTSRYFLSDIKFSYYPKSPSLFFCLDYLTFLLTSVAQLLLVSFSHIKNRAISHKKCIHSKDLQSLIISS